MKPVAYQVSRAGPIVAHVQVKMRCGHYDYIDLEPGATLILNDQNALTCEKCSRRISSEEDK